MSTQHSKLRTYNSQLPMIHPLYQLLGWHDQDMFAAIAIAVLLTLAIATIALVRTFR